MEDGDMGDGAVVESDQATIAKAIESFFGRRRAGAKRAAPRPGGRQAAH